MLVFGLYALFLLALGLYQARRNSTFAAFYLNERASGTGLVGISIVASCVGGSATIGMVGLAWEVGTPAFWWLGSGACGLALLTVFLARTIRASGACTMPELVSRYLGPGARPVVSGIIVVAWLAILAAQFRAMGTITAALTGLEATAAIMIGAAVIVGYAVLGGQASVMRSDVPQYALMLLGLCCALGWLAFNNPQPLAAAPLELWNESFPVSRLTYFMLILGGSYVVCPMLFGRFLSARNSPQAVRGGWLAVACILGTACIIVGLGIACRGVVPADTAPEAVLTIMLGLLPAWAGTVLMVALLSAVLSSADSCIITAATVCCHDLIRTDNVRVCRGVTLLLGLGGLALALRGHGILNLLLMANDVYVCGVVVPVFYGMVTHARLRIAPQAVLAALMLGSGGGLISSLTGSHEAGYAGMAASLLCLIAGSRRRGAHGPQHDAATQP